MESNSFSDLMWIEKYRPKEVKDIILPKRISFENLLNKNLLFYGTAGIGKTTLAMLIAKNYSTKFISCGIDSSIENLRTDILDFCQTTSILHPNKVKYIILDEFDVATDKFKEAIRPVIEKFSNNVRFIGTSNYIDKFSESLLSRFMLINLNFTKDDEKELMLKFAKRLSLIAKNESFEIVTDQLISIIKSTLPSFRNSIQILESYKNGLIKIDSIGNITSGIFEILFNEKLTQYQTYSEIMTNYQNRVDEVFSELSKKIVENLKSRNFEYLIGSCGILIHKYWYESKNCADKAAALWVCVYELQNLLKNSKIS